MAIINIKATAQCGSGGHVEITAQVDSSQSRKLTYHVAELRQDVTGEETQAMVLALCRIHGIGISDAQLKADLQTGLSMTI